MSEQIQPNPNSFPNTSEIPSKEGLTWQDIVKVSKHTWGLLHVSQKKAAQYEFENGIDGKDALAISSVASLLLRIPDIDPSLRQLGAISDLSKTESRISEADRQQLVKKFGNSVTQFIRYGVGESITKSIPQAETVSNILDIMANASSFLIADYGLSAKFGYDHVTYSDLGKCGRANISPEGMQGIIMPPSKEIMTPSFTPEILRASAIENFAEINTTFTNHYYQEFVEFVKREA